MYKSEISAFLFAAGLIVLFFFVFFEDLRLHRPANIIFGFIIVCCRFFTSCPIFYYPFVVRMLCNWNCTVCFEAIQIAFVFKLLLLVCCIISINFNRSINTGKYYSTNLENYVYIYLKTTPFQWDLTMYLPMIVLCSFICLPVGLYFLMLHVTNNVRYTFFIYRLLISICLFMVCIFPIHISFNTYIFIAQFIMYHAQLIRGGRHAEFRPFDYWLGAVTLYLDFLFLLLFSFEVSPKWSDPCNKNSTFVFILDHYAPKLRTSY